MKKEDCIFCKIVNKEIPCAKIWEDDKTLAFLDIQPVNKGHVLVIPKFHSELVSKTDDEYLTALIKVSKKISSLIRKSSIKCEDINFYIADGKKAGQEIPHLHIHIIPRYEGDGFSLKFPRGHDNKPSFEELNKLAQEILK